MANTVIRSDMLREIIRLKEKGYSNTKISVALGISRTTLIDYQKKIASTGQITADLLSLSEQDLWVLIHGPSPGSERSVVKSPACV